MAIRGLFLALCGFASYSWLMLRAALILILLPTVVFSQTKLHPIARSDIRVSGDLSHRILLNYARLTDSYYTPDHLATISPGWPGDAIGREILALTLLAQSTGNESPGLDLLIENVSAHLNDNGYVGPVLTGAVQNEQYLSGHSWLLRGLCEHFAWKHDDRSLSLMRRITGGLLLRSRNQYRHYPIRAEDRSKKGEVAGNITRTVDGWELSTDVGCAFIMLDGATAAQQVIPSRELESLIKEMIARFEQVDLVKVAAQTHATLSALRGILRFYESHPDPKYLEFVTRTYALYFSAATTEHYANYNWFTRPEWTEACAVVDSYMLAMQLYAITRDAHYLEDAQLIYYNALSHAQRANGGFGCDVCVGATPAMTVLKAHEIYEAPFCCSMRGAEGLTAATTYCYLQGSEHEIVLPIFHDNTAMIHFSNGSLRLVESTTYPNSGSVRLSVVESSLSQPVKFRFFLPSWTPVDSVKVAINDSPFPRAMTDSFVSLSHPCKAGDQIALSFDVPFRTAPALHADALPGLERHFHGPLLLGKSPTGGSIAIRNFTDSPDTGLELLFTPDSGRAQ
jgi:uncharacterized protein